MSSEIQNVDVTVNSPGLAKILKMRPNGIIKVPFRNGAPTDIWWRRRVEDSAIDGCISFTIPAEKQVEAIAKPAIVDKPVASPPATEAIKHPSVEKVAAKKSTSSKGKIDAISKS